MKLELWFIEFIVKKYGLLSTYNSWDEHQHMPG